jgi:hypothetical protein
LLSFSHLSPPSFERYVPRSSSLASIVATMTSCSVAGTTSPMRPMSPAGSPFVSFVHVSPPSVLFQMPEPGPPSINVHTLRWRW